MVAVRARTDRIQHRLEAGLVALAQAAFFGVAESQGAQPVGADPQQVVGQVNSEVGEEVVEHDAPDDELLDSFLWID